MPEFRLLPWPDLPSATRLPSIGPGMRLRFNLGEPWGQAIAIAAAYCAREGLSLEPSPGLEGPRLIDGDTVVEDPVAVAKALAPGLFPDEEVEHRVIAVRQRLLDAVYRLGRIVEQAAYERAHAELARDLDSFNDRLVAERYLSRGAEPDFSDVLLFAFSIRLEPVYYELYKATVGGLDRYSHVRDHARDLFERAPFHETTDFEQIKRAHYEDEPLLNPRSIIPRGGRPDLDGPHERDSLRAAPSTRGTDDSAHAGGPARGEFVRPVSQMRRLVGRDPDLPAEPGRYHIFAPYNCPWSHRALLARAVKGLDEVVGASVVYFRRHSERGWQFNGAIEGCTEDQVGGKRFVVSYYEAVGSAERSVPILWDTETSQIVNNESADIMRMLNRAFGALATRDIDLYPERFRDAIDRLNAFVYQRINNGAYKAGFAKSQHAYDRAFARYFRALDELERLLGEHRWLAGTPAATEADLRLFPTVFRHDTIYFNRFKLNQRTISSYRHFVAVARRYSGPSGGAGG
ncbi:MAG: glutathione S-transferase C-terminal domain-containing protein, partial [Myxococcota bacterium]